MHCKMALEVTEYSSRQLKSRLCSCRYCRCTTARQLLYQSCLVSRFFGKIELGAEFKSSGEIPIGIPSPNPDSLLYLLPESPKTMRYFLSSRYVSQYTKMEALRSCSPGALGLQSRTLRQPRPTCKLDHISSMPQKFSRGSPTRDGST